MTYGCVIPPPSPRRPRSSQRTLRELVADDASPTLAAAREELTRALTALAGKPPALVGSPTQSGALILGTARLAG